MPAVDPFELFSGYSLDTLTGSGLSGFPVTPHDTDELPLVTRAVYIGTGGDIVCILKNDGSPVTFKNLADGSLLPLRIRKILATGTTALHIVGLI